MKDLEEKLSYLDGLIRTEVRNVLIKVGEAGLADDLVEALIDVWAAAAPVIDEEHS